MGYRLLYFLATFVISQQCFGQGKLFLYSNLEPSQTWLGSALAWAQKQATDSTIAILYAQDQPEFLFSEIDSQQLKWSAWSLHHKLPLDSLAKTGIWIVDWQQDDAVGLPNLPQLIRKHFQSGGVLIAPIWIEQQILVAYPDFLFSSIPGIQKGEDALLAHMARRQKRDRFRYNGLVLGPRVALAINELGQATVVGEGAIRLYFNDISTIGFGLDPEPVNDSLHILQLVPGDHFHFRSWASSEFPEKTLPKWQGEEANFSLLMSGSNAMSENTRFLDALVQSHGEAEDPILLISSWHGSNLEVLKVLLSQRGVSEVFHLNPDSALQRDPILRNQIIQSDKRLFAGNNLNSLQAFLNGGSNGSLLSNQMREAGAFNAFLGEDSRWVGPNSFSSSGRSSLQGLGLLRNTTIFPITEAEAAHMADPTWLMLRDSLQFGLVLYPETYVRYQVLDGTAYLSPSGNRSVKIFHQTDGSFRHPHNKEEKAPGFGNMKLSLVHNRDFPVGNVQTSLLTSRGSHQDWLTIYPNPFRDHLNVFFYGQQTGDYDFQLISSQGELILSQKERLSPSVRQIKIKVPRVSPGIYLLLIRDGEQKVVRQLSLIH